MSGYAFEPKMAERRAGALAPIRVGVLQLPVPEGLMRRPPAQLDLRPARRPPAQLDLRPARRPPRPSAPIPKASDAPPARPPIPRPPHLSAPALGPPSARPLGVPPAARPAIEATSLLSISPVPSVPHVPASVWARIGARIRHMAGSMGKLVAELGTLATVGYMALFYYLEYIPQVRKLPLETYPILRDFRPEYTHFLVQYGLPALVGALALTKAVLKFADRLRTVLDLWKSFHPPAPPAPGAAP